MSGGRACAHPTKQRTRKLKNTFQKVSESVRTISFRLPSVPTPTSVSITGLTDDPRPYQIPAPYSRNQPLLCMQRCTGLRVSLYATLGPPQLPQVGQEGGGAIEYGGIKCLLGFCCNRVGAGEARDFVRHTKTAGGDRHTRRPTSSYDNLHVVDCRLWPERAER